MLKEIEAVSIPIGQQMMFKEVEASDNLNTICSQYVKRSSKSKKLIEMLHKFNSSHQKLLIKAKLKGKETLNDLNIHYK